MSEDAPSLRPRVVIVGAGFGGLQVARGLADAPVDIILVDKHNYHCFQPLLYQVATAVLSPADVAWPVRHILSRQDNVTMLMAQVTGVDRAAQALITSEGPIPYDFLVLATGATHSYFGHEEWAPFAPGLKDIQDATHLRRRILVAFERAEASDDEAARRRLLTFVIIGGGPTGVEMAGSIAEIARHALAPDFKRVDPRTARILLIEAGPRLLPVLTEPLSAYARRRLEAMGVEVLTGRPVVDIGADHVELAGGEIIPASTKIWAAGVRASPAAQWLGVETDRAGRCLVGPDLSVPDAPEIFVIGDTAAVSDPAGKPVPGIAPAAKQMGDHVAKAIEARLAGSTAPAFRYRHDGDLATIGRNSAVVKLGRLELTGFLGWMFWGFIHVYFLIGTRNRIAVALAWLWNYVTHQRAARLITGEPEVSEAESKKPPLRQAS
ncbi:FAD-dependent pyridine nucleotide-disulfide oxidoreductase [Ancylobacter novellus DSM 506]|uniref:NADH:ubiquinone reductase (non-electrogenic) n=1 Tax=Ancylobacter novellus (strain ATCC 8093 / DSM 506 / JCM 20403 / CCM 1077 / IAM 12100 / NBRC 12443 / NCIMB 10456) TaxID=639283 RepID=D7AA73_ANCN5|nr:NAD(P)/FAD-dependent oxidoreductase [Ancylobacter novellus]ADH90860.1 FAD-dependent pyridine nucleotide-disulfide oxidoreductase [Ancylobacter novellus DSM 506]